MVLPEFNKAGDLPPGVYQATLDETVERFGAARGRRNICTRRLLHVYALAQRTGHLYGASIFWVRPGLLVSESIEDFVAYWQIKRDGSKRGIVEVIP